MIQIRGKRHVRDFLLSQGWSQIDHNSLIKKKEFEIEDKHHSITFGIHLRKNSLVQYTKVDKEDWNLIGESLYLDTIIHEDELRTLR